jgi:hypothetical protein
MLIKDFEKHLQERVDSDLKIMTHPNPDIKDIKIVLWRGFNISIALPPEQIFDNLDRTYKDFGGNPYRTKGMAVRDIKAKLAVVRKKMAQYETNLPN